MKIRIITGENMTIDGKVKDELIESRLPDAEYIRQFQSFVYNNSTTIDLKIEIMDKFYQPNIIQQELLKRDIQILSVDTSNFMKPSMTYRGQSEDLQTYKITIKRVDSARQRIELHATGKQNLRQGIADIVDVIAEYTRVYEKSLDEKEKKNQ